MIIRSLFFSGVLPSKTSVSLCEFHQQTKEICRLQLWAHTSTPPTPSHPTVQPTDCLKQKIQGSERRAFTSFVTYSTLADVTITTITGRRGQQGGWCFRWRYATFKIQKQQQWLLKFLSAYCKLLEGNVVNNNDAIDVKN